MSKYELPSGAADIDAAGNMQEIDFRYPHSGKPLREAMQEALVELWKAKERIAELEAAVSVQNEVIDEFTSGKGDMTD